MDPQANLTVGLGINLSTVHRSMADVLGDERGSTRRGRRADADAGIDVAPATLELASTEVELFSAIGREQVLRDAIDGWADGSYDFVIIDCPPTLGLLTINALVASDGVIIPVQTQYYAIKGLTALIKVINTIRTKLNHDLAILGLLPTFFDGRTVLAREMLEELRELGDHHVFTTMVRNTVKLGEAPLTGRPITAYAGNSEAARALPRAGTGGHRTWLDPTSAPTAAGVSSEERELPPRSQPDRRRRPSSQPAPQLPVDRIEPNPDQPRTAFDEEALDELAASIREHGVLQPILVRPIGDRIATSSSPANAAGGPRMAAGCHDPRPDRGDRRRDRPGDRIIENLQREDLSPLEEAVDVRPDDRRARLQHPASSPRSSARTRATSRTGFAWPTHRPRSSSWCLCAKTPSPMPTSC